MALNINFWQGATKLGANVEKESRLRGIAKLNNKLNHQTDDAAADDGAAADGSAKTASQITVIHGTLICITMRVDVYGPVW